MDLITRKLADVASIVGGTTPKSEMPQYWDGGHVWITPTDLGNLQGDTISGSERKITDAGLDSCNLTKVTEGAIVMSSRAPIGHLAIAGCDLFTNQGCKSFVCGEEINNEFLFFLLKYNVPVFQSLGRGATFKEISKGTLESFEITFPKSKDKQRRIAACLKDQMAEIDKARQAAEKQLQEIDLLPRKILAQALAGDAQSKGGVVEGVGLVTRKLADITSIVSGTTPKSEMPQYWDGEHVWITPTDLGNLQDNTISSSERKITDAGLDSCNLTKVTKGAIIMSSRAPIGHLAIAGCDLFTNQGCKSFVCGEEINNEFLFFLLKHNIPVFQSLGSGATFKEISKGVLGSFEVTFPKSKDKQRQIATCLQAQFAEVAKARRAAEIRRQEIRLLPQKILSQAFEMSS